MPLMNPRSDRISNFQRLRRRVGWRRTDWGRRASRPRLELLEDRTLLSIDVVENSNDSGAGSLRETIANASAGDTIEFNMSAGHVTSPITLTSGQVEIAVNLTIEGPGAGTLAISGNQLSRVFDVPSGVTATIDGLTIEKGAAQSAQVPGSAAHGGGIYNAGTLILANDSFDSNTASGTATSSGFKITTGSGGAIYNAASANLSVNGSSFAGNSAVIRGRRDLCRGRPGHPVHLHCRW